MNISRFFIDRPIFAAVLSLLIFIAGFISIWKLPISEYPEVVPPSVVVHAQYPGANPRVISSTVAAPLEEQINGVEGMLYMFSQGTSDGQMNLTITFQLGTDPDKAQQLVQNRVNQALPRLPDIVRQFGVTTVKSASDLTMVVHLLSPNERYNMLYLGNYATLNIKDRISRLPGIGQVRVFGGSDYAMRIWLDPEKIAARGMTAADVVNAIREQNVQVAAGIIGAQPAPKDVELQLNVNAHGRLQSEEEFGDIVLKTDQKGAVVHLRDVARIELGGAQYALRSLLDNKPAVALGIFQAPGSNALDVSDNVRKLMGELKKDFPEGVDYRIVYDPTTFVRESISAVVHTLLEAITLVVLVVILFLQTWRASIIPLLAVPVSVVGTFALMLVFGFSINALSLFGLVLSIGIVVDDAIVVVENVERNIAAGLSPKDATYQAMREVSGPIIAIGLSLIAVFVPIAFISGLTGQFYRQFALTIAISTVISAFNSLTLSPAMAALLLRGHDAPKEPLTLAMGRLIGWLFVGLVLLLAPYSVFRAATGHFNMAIAALLAIVWLFTAPKYFLASRRRETVTHFFDKFNNFFHAASERYSVKLFGVIQNKKKALLAYTGLIVLTGALFWSVPMGYIPLQDKQYIIGFAKLPEGASLDRTEVVMRNMSEVGLNTPGVKNSVAFPGLSIAGFSTSSSTGIVFMPLKSFDERDVPWLSAGAIAGGLMEPFMSTKDALIVALPPPPVRGIGTNGGFTMQLQDRADLGEEALARAKDTILQKARQNPQIAGQQTYSNYQINVPQLQVDIDRTKAKQLGIPITSIFDTMQIYLGSLYVNDFNQFGRTYQVVVQADSPFRSYPEDISKLKVRAASGEMVPLGTVVSVKPSYGPEQATRYNGYRSADINAAPAPGYSSGQAQAALEKIVQEVLPKGMSYEWTDLAYQQILAGDTSFLIFPLCVLLVFLVLAAQYESLTLPMAVIMIVPMCLFSAMTGVWIAMQYSNLMAIISGYPGAVVDNNIFTQIGLIVLVGLACKNAILIVEFARELELEGADPLQAALEAARLRLRPILMTSFAFVMGVLPLVFSTGAGAEMRHAMGLAVFSGMLGVTFFGLFLTPIFYVVLRTLSHRRLTSASAPALDTHHGGHPHE